MFESPHSDQKIPLRKSAAGFFYGVLSVLPRGGFCPLPGKDARILLILPPKLLSGLCDWSGLCYSREYQNSTKSAASAAYSGTTWIIKRSISHKTKITTLFISLILVVTLAGRTAEKEQPSAYAQAENRAYLEVDKTADADVFFICPTVYGGDEDSFNMPMDDEDAKSDFLGAANMEKGIYDSDARFFAPYYRQAGLNVYELPAEDREEYLALAYADIKEAFLYYLEHCNNGRPIILAGFSQGGDMSIRLLKDCFAEEKVNELLVACYAIGWSVSEEDLEQYPHLRFASGEDDTGVIISFNSEAESVTDSLMIPAGTHTLAINPLNWKTDSTPAGKEENLGA